MVKATLALIVIVLLSLYSSVVNGQSVICSEKCIPFSECESAQKLFKESGIRPKICHFVKFEPYVCCSNDTTTETLNNNITELDRPSKKRCKELYPPACPEGYLCAVAGFETEPDEFPFMAAVGYGTIQDAVFNCGGFLVERNYVLTAAHCADYNGVQPTYVRIGGSPLESNGTEVIKVSRVIIHPKYRKESDYHDIAILKLSKNAIQKPACLHTDGELPEYNRDVVATGYGSTSFGGAFAKRFLKVYLSVIENQECQKFYSSSNQNIIDSQMCVIGKTRMLNNSEIAIQDTCQGDSGGPLILQSSIWNGPSIVGIVSYGQSCGTSTPGVYTKILSYLDWTESIIWPPNETGDRYIVS